MSRMKKIIISSSSYPDSSRVDVKKISNRLVINFEHATRHRNILRRIGNFDATKQIFTHSWNDTRIALVTNHCIRLSRTLHHENRKTEKRHDENNHSAGSVSTSVWEYLCFIKEWLQCKLPINRMRKKVRLFSERFLHKETLTLIHFQNRENIPFKAHVHGNKWIHREMEKPNSTVFNVYAKKTKDREHHESKQANADIKNEIQDFEITTATETKKKKKNTWKIKKQRKKNSYSY